jgi:hypothetical protein
MKINDKYYIKKKNFVAKLSEVLNMAKPHLICEYKLGEELPPEKKWYNFIENGEVVKKQVEEQPSGEFVIVTCANGHTYRVDVTANSLVAIGEEVFKKMCCK